MQHDLLQLLDGFIGSIEVDQEPGSLLTRLEVVRISGDSPSIVLDRFVDVALLGQQDRQVDVSGLEIRVDFGGSSEVGDGALDLALPGQNCPQVIVGGETPRLLVESLLEFLDGRFQLACLDQRRSQC